MGYTVEIFDHAFKQLSKLDKPVQKLLLNWLEKNLQGTENPRLKGKGLVGNHSREWRYRVGDYRIIVDIQDKVLIVLIIAVGHRKDIYL
ncbi:MAG TPA: type II toxin-antitoxin system RelE/ParE family toxin [Anaerolineaceae bacterium]|nr:type II toxin-antitoxin system RelE/ParE family toxin [Anaerolineaceae bacterium]